jgi:hypothetical protein
MMRGKPSGSSLARPHTCAPLGGQLVLNSEPVNAVERSLSLVNTSMKCAPRISCFLKTAPRCPCSRKPDSIGRGPGYGSHIGSEARTSPVLPGAP